MEGREKINAFKVAATSQPWVSRVYIVDDHRFFTFALASLVNTQADLAVCGVGHDESEAMEGIIHLSPDIVVMDVRLNASDGLSLATAVRRFSKHLPILFVSSLQKPSFEQDAKWQDPTDIIRGIRQTLANFRLYQSIHPTSSPNPKT